MAYGYIVEKTLRADDNDALNRNAICTAADVEGGNAVIFGAYKEGVYTVTLSTNTASKGVGMAYNPTEHLTKVGDKFFAGLSADPRDYVNIKGRPFDVFIPQPADIVGFTDADINGTKPDGTTNPYLIQDNSGKWKAANAAGNGIAWKFLEKTVLPFPQAGVGNELADLYVCECVQN